MRHGPELIVVAMASFLQAAAAFAQPEFVDSKPVADAFAPIVVPTSPPSPAERPRSAFDPGRESFSRALFRLVERKDFDRIPPEETPDLFLIDPAVGAAGLRFGMSIDEVVRIWGKPDNIDIDSRLREGAWDLSLGFSANRFEFSDDRLHTISVHGASLKRAAFKDGIGFDSSVEEVLQKYGPQLSERGNSEHSQILCFEDGGTEVEFHFVSNRVKEDLHLIAVQLSRKSPPCQ